MPDDQRIPDPEEEEARVEGDILNLLIDAENQRPWSIEEVIREHGNRQDALDGINRLHSAGLLHRTTEGFVFATRAALRYSQIGG
jgi:hypothetical protein